MKLANISLYTVDGVHEYRKIMGAEGAVAILVKFHSYSSLIGCLLLYFYSYALIGPCSVFPSGGRSMDSDVIRTANRESHIITSFL